MHILHFYEKTAISGGNEHVRQLIVQQNWNVGYTLKHAHIDRFRTVSCLAKEGGGSPFAADRYTRAEFEDVFCPFYLTWHREKMYSVI